ncbi:hypothetical protein L207DRAFT_590592 [Hyaloscypha variabilis F]|uniref:Uncharacterized protein n=1 Tax=Hyaloscypha variabilis (strain UAMH 11265 / GT02V1 / F) TaxID=1149755 RepID=A0A2J6R1A6_HYAVF|nr:hypothetical protein L207DRAFT_590592 [Hyaloscypha variabilis F]
MDAGALLQKLAAPSNALSYSKEDLANRIFQRFREPLLRMVKTGLPTIASAQKHILVNFGEDLTYYYYAVPCNVWDELGLRVGNLLRSYLSVAGVRHEVVKSFLAAFILYYESTVSARSSNSDDSSARREVIVTNFCLLSDDQRLRAARAMIELFQVTLSSDDDEDDVTMKALDWGRTINDGAEPALAKLNEVRQKVGDPGQFEVGDETADYVEATLTLDEVRLWWAVALTEAFKAGNSHHLIQDLGWKGFEAGAFFRTASSATRGFQPEALAFLDFVENTTHPKLCSLTPKDEATAQRFFRGYLERIMSALKAFERLSAKTGSFVHLLQVLRTLQPVWTKLLRDIGKDYNVGLRFVRLLLVESRAWAISASARMHFTQPLLHTCRDVRGYGIWTLNGEGTKIRMMYDRTISNYSFLANYTSIKMFQKVGIQRIYAGFYHNDTPVLAEKKGREWGSKIRDTARNHALRLQEKYPSINVQIYRDKWADGFLAAETSGRRNKWIQDLRWSDANARAFFASAQRAFLE